MSTSAQLAPGQLLDGYRIEELVAESAMACTYRATDVRDGSLVAIKLPYAGTEADPALAERFRREEEIGLALRHPGVRRTLAPAHRSRSYLVMEWVSGRLLRQILHQEGRLAPRRALHLAESILSALDYIHGRGIVHRDLKPENILVGDQDQIKLIDFGIAAKEGARRVTWTGFAPTLGTPDYIAPEQVKGKRGDQRADLYALGAMLYEMLTGRPPFSGPSPLAVMNERLLRPPRPPRDLEPSITPQLQEVLYRALEREPRNRYASAQEFLHDLRNLDEVGVADRAETAEWRQPGEVRRTLLYAALILIPILFFAVLLFLERRP